MPGAIVGDIAGSRFEIRNIKTKEFELFNEYCRFTDDSVMTIAVGSASVFCESFDGDEGRTDPRKGAER